MSDLYDYNNEDEERIARSSKEELEAKAREAERAKRELKKALKAEKKAKKAEKKAERKAKGTGKKVAATIGLACIFGIAASLVFNCSNAIFNKLNKNTKANATAIEEEVKPDESSEEAKPDVKKSDNKAREIERNVDFEDGKDDTEASKLVTDDGLTVAQVAAESMPSIVAITNKSIQELRSMYGMGVQQYEAVSSGSGIIIGQNDTELLIVTNAHVVSDADDLSVCFIDEEAYGAKIKGTDDSNDLAVISVDLNDIAGTTLDAITSAKIGNSDELKIGEQVVAIGNALGYGQSVTTGIVSALDRSIEGIEQGTNYIQTDAAINPGNSGGALLNMKGELIGINSAKLASAKIEGMGYAIPISAASPILDDLMNMVTRSLVDDKESGYLGITGFSVTNEVANTYNIPKGIYISETEKDSAAEKGGIQKGDVIIKFDGMKMDSINKLKDRLHYYKAGETVDVVVARSDDGEYKEKTLKVTLGERKDVVDESKPDSDKQSDTDTDEGNNNQKSGEFNIGGNSFQYSIPNDLFDFFK